MHSVVLLTVTLARNLSGVLAHVPGMTNSKHSCPHNLVRLAQLSPFTNQETEALRG